MGPERASIVPFVTKGDQLIQIYGLNVGISPTDAAVRKIIIYSNKEDNIRWKRLWNE